MLGATRKMTDAEVHLKAAPSKEAVVRYLMGQENAAQAVIKSFVERTVLVGVGIALFGNRDHLVRNSLAASFAIEVYLLWYYNKQIKGK